MVKYKKTKQNKKQTVLITLAISKKKVGLIVVIKFGPFA